MNKKYKCVHGIIYDFLSHAIYVNVEGKKAINAITHSPNIYNVICQQCLLELCLNSNLVHPIEDEILLTANPEE